MVGATIVFICLCGLVHTKQIELLNDRLDEQGKALILLGNAKSITIKPTHVKALLPPVKGEYGKVVLLERK